MQPSGIITLLTDFGLGDAYVAMMKGVILEINPRAALVDVTHQVKPGAVFQAAALLEESFTFFPKGTVHLAVVDPGVGGLRRPIALAADDHYFVGPDNGLFGPVIQKHRKVRVAHLIEEKYFHAVSSPTFHGRQIFAPAAAWLSKGLELEALGPMIQDPVPLDLPRPWERNGFLYGQIMRIDRFGNLITNINREKLAEFLGSDSPLIRVGHLSLNRIHSTYVDVKPGEVLALLDSSGRLEIAVNRGRAVDLLCRDGKELVGQTVQVAKSV